MAHTNRAERQAGDLEPGRARDTRAGRLECRARVAPGPLSSGATSGRRDRGSQQAARLLFILIHLASEMISVRAALKWRPATNKRPSAGGASALRARRADDALRCGRKQLRSHNRAGPALGALLITLDQRQHRHRHRHHHHHHDHGRRHLRLRRPAAVFRVYGARLPVAARNCSGRHREAAAITFHRCARKL